MSRRSSVYVIKVNYQVTTLEQFSVPEDKTCSEKTECGNSEKTYSLCLRGAIHANLFSEETKQER